MQLQTFFEHLEAKNYIMDSLGMLNNITDVYCKYMTYTIHVCTVVLLICTSNTLIKHANPHCRMSLQMRQP